MLFNIDEDNGHNVRLWITLDNPQKRPRIVLKGRGLKNTIIEANVVRKDLIDIGLHSTGHAGFELSNKNVPDLEKISDLQIFEQDNDLPIYARISPTQHLRLRLFVFGIKDIRSKLFLRQLERRFAMSCRNVADLNTETTNAILTNPEAHSIIVSGTTYWGSLREIFDKVEYLKFCYVSDPYFTLANELLSLKKNLTLVSSYFNEIESGDIRDLDILDSQQLIRFFRKLVRQSHTQLRSPLTRLLSCIPGQEPESHDIATALKVLSDFDLVMTTSSIEYFASLLDISVTDQNKIDDDCMRLIELLKGIGSVSDLLSEDITLFERVESSIGEVRAKMNNFL